MITDHWLAPPGPRLRLTRGQQLVAGVLVLLLIALVVVGVQSSAQQSAHAHRIARNEAVSANTFFTVRDSLTYVDHTQQYLLGVVPRRDVQLARALLAQRLRVIGANEVSAAEATTAEYRRALTALDGALAEAPAGVLAVDQRNRWARIIVPKADVLSEATRALAVSSPTSPQSVNRRTEEDLMRDRVIELSMLITALVLGAVLLWWVAANVVRQYRSARTALDDERQALRKTEVRLDRVSALERGQARVLERIATADPVPSVLRQIAQLAADVTGAAAVRIALGARSVVYPSGADVSADPAWTGTVTDTADITGTLEVLGDPHALDDLARTALVRCRDLVTLALERDASARRLSYQASHDALTGLANRGLLLARLSQSLLMARERGTPLALLFCDLDRFKIVNDSIGHAGGDQLLIEAARRLSGTVRESDTVARLGGDEFVVLCPELPDRAQAIALAERIRTTLSASYTIDGQEAFVDASIGITFADESTVSGAELMREADVAMYRAKLTGGGHINVFDSSLEAEVAQRLDFDTALRHAVERRELRLSAQPIVMLDTGTVTGFEVLLQWHRPGLPVLYPGAFIPLAEDNGMIVEIGRWVLRETTETLAGWRADGLALDLTMSVNVSPRQVREPGFAEEVLRFLDTAGLPPESLIIELTEHALVDLRVAHPTLARLREAGVSVSLDDFGTGYSSLTQLSTLPVDQIKLDRSFAAALDEGDAKQRGVVQSVVSLASALDLDLVVEGIETVAERDTLLDLGARIGQGFLYHQPVLWDLARQLLESGGVCALSSDGDQSGRASSAEPSPSASISFRSQRPSPSVST
ncbi:EAL domain-containing protein [Mycobacterium sp. CVI_P3]|uniref:EAL domain-containing protein n=1 Tax=Mycobacterium pinniadriaticum TaxID=2994102 RepID=A0ABT3S8N9_9MYCO|nr:EAL domain-containing protein [Mycobacterium pinniadriaticum]MCX2929303.1 EAL domain-containing protein [Mycobacterium pinniadriaticum]MCX2935727.1 EAL domain-containing protein [Mycobacterium pinniadriaticum]